MVFTRRILARTYTDYTRYRPFLRQDFRHRCVYCLRHEFFLGGEAGCEIDHHRPQRGSSARPDLISVYENLYWCCVECNQNKGDTWPSLVEYARGQHFLDPCLPHDDHELHWRSEPDGSLVALTPIGEYTIAHLLLWREQLAYLRQLQTRWQQELSELLPMCEEYELTDLESAALEARVLELRSWIEPPVFDRPRR